MPEFDASAAARHQPTPTPDASAGTAEHLCLFLQPVRVEMGGVKEEGCLVFADGCLAAVLVRLSDSFGASSGQWFLEYGFGLLGDSTHPCFPDLDAAQNWIRHSLASGAAPTTGGAPAPS